MRLIQHSQSAHDKYLFHFSGFELLGQEENYILLREKQFSATSDLVNASF
jgi:hypothetical protein